MYIIGSLPTYVNQNNQIIWVYDSIHNKLIIDSKKRYGGEGIYTLEKLSKKEMILVNDTLKIYFKK